MAYVQKTRLEEVAAAIQELRWYEMMQLADYLAKVEFQDKPDAPEWAAHLHGWSEDVFAGFSQRCEEAKEGPL